MIIRDLEHYEIDSQVNPIEKVEGGFFSFLAANISMFSINTHGNSISMTQIDMSSQVITSGGTSVSSLSMRAVSATFAPNYSMLGPFRRGSSPFSFLR